MDDKELISLEELEALQKDVLELKQSYVEKEEKCKVLNTQIKKLETVLDRINKKKKGIINKNISKRENISRKIDLFCVLPIGLGTIISIIIFGFITRKLGITLEYICVASLSVSSIMVLKMVVEMVIDNHIIEKLSKTKEYTNIEDLRKEVEKTLDEIKNKRIILKESKDIEVEIYNDKIQRLYEVELSLSGGQITADQDKKNIAIRRERSIKDK